MLVLTRVLVLESEAVPVPSASAMGGAQLKNRSGDKSLLPEKPACLLRAGRRKWREAS